MLKIYNCIATAHDLKLVGLAALVCVLASFAAINLLRHAGKSHGHMRAVGLAVSLTPSWRHGPWVGGTIVGGGIAAMHYTGMAAFEIAGVILWEPVLVAASIVLGALIGAVALPVGLHGKGQKWK